jgi:hypothetical protein
VTGLPYRALPPAQRKKSVTCILDGQNRHQLVW